MRLLGSPTPEQVRGVHQERQHNDISTHPAVLRPLGLGLMAHHSHPAGLLTHAGGSLLEGTMLHINVMTRPLRTTLSNRRYAERHRGEEQARHRRYHATVRKGRVRNPIKRNPERRRASMAAWYVANSANLTSREAINAYNRKQRAKHPEVHKAANQRRRALKRGNGGSYTAAEWQSLKTAFGRRCVGCWKNEAELKLIGRTLTPDHIIPISRHGMNIIENIQPLCHGTGGCNNRKGAKYLDYLVAY
jgi:5-methylcytosine-specific restriction endonuclease McrA